MKKTTMLIIGLFLLTGCNSYYLPNINQTDIYFLMENACLDEPGCNNSVYETDHKIKMTSSKPTEVGSFHSQEKRKMAYNNRTTLTVAPRKPLNLNCSLIEKSLMCGSLNGQPIAEDNYHLVIGDNYDETRISTLQSNEVRFRCKNSNSEDRFSLQVQYQLPYYMDSKIQTESFERQGGRCA